MQAKLKVENPTDVSDEPKASSMQDTMKRLNIIDMTGSAVQTTSSLLTLQKENKQRPNVSKLLQKVQKVKDESKFNVKALVQKEEYQENLRVHLEQELESLN